MAYFGVDKAVRIEELNLQFQNVIRQRGAGGLHQLRAQFQAFDKNGNGKLDLREFECALAGYGLFPSKNDLKQLHQYYDVSGDGQISYEEFVGALGVKLSPRKQGVVDKLWAQVDPEAFGKCKGSDLVGQLRDPEAMKSMVLDSFAQTKGGEESGNVSQEEFYQWAIERAVECPDDSTYISNMEEFWKVSEDAHAPLDNIRIMHLLGLMRQRLITKANAQQEEYKLRDMFRRFDTDNSGALSINELAGLLAELGVRVTDPELAGMFKVMDTSGNGVVEFEEFHTFLVVDPYKKFEFS